MNEPIDPNLMRRLNDEHQDLRVQLSRLPRREAPAALLHQLRRQYMRRTFFQWMKHQLSWPLEWKPVGVLAAGALLAGVWISRWHRSEEEFIDVQPLVTAHSRYQAEGLMPQSDMAGSNFGAQLAVYYGDEN